MRSPTAKSRRKLTDGIGGFPLFSQRRRQRVITADPWSLLLHLALDRKKVPRAESFIDQAFDFYEAAQNPRIGSKPLLYYYSFLNLAKAALLVSGISIPATAKHGIVDPRVNVKQRLRLEGQTLRISPLGKDHSELFPSLVELLGGDAAKARTVKVLDALAQVPGIHRTFTQVTRRHPVFLPIREIELFQDKAGVLGRLSFKRYDQDTRRVLREITHSAGFKRVLHAVKSDKPDELWFETKTVTAHGRALDRGLARLANLLLVTESIRLSTIVTTGGYRFYISAAKKSAYLHPLAAIYAGMFYLGSITRYKPEDFDKILSGGYSWIVEEFIATAPVQFLYILASHLAGTVVVRPYAAID